MDKREGVTRCQALETLLFSFPCSMSSTVRAHFLFPRPRALKIQDFLLLARLCQWVSPGYSAPELDSAQSGQAAFMARKKNNTKPGLQNRLFVLTIGPVPFPTPNL